jgi:hypothetical protein
MLSRPTLARSSSGLATLAAFAGVALAFVLMAEGQSFAADDPNCPPGSWFCGEGQAQGAAQAPAAPAAAGEAPAAAAPAAATPASAGTPPPPVIIYQAPSSEPPPPYVYTPRDPPLHRQWAIGANLQLPLYVKRNGGDGGFMGGVGGLLRFRPRGGVFAMQGEIGSYAGSDYNNDRRAEFAMAGNIMFFVMPKKKTSLYFLGGLGFATAHVSRDGYVPYDARNNSYTSQPSSSNFAYFGAQTGIGLEVGLGTHFALDFQLRGFMRQRIDSAPEPEFVSGSGQTTNASAGGLLSAGLNYYF